MPNDNDLLELQRLREQLEPRGFLFVTDAIVLAEAIEPAPVAESRILMKYRFGTIPTWEVCPATPFEEAGLLAPALPKELWANPRAFDRASSSLAVCTGPIGVPRAALVAMRLADLVQVYPQLAGAMTAPAAAPAAAASPAAEPDPASAPKKRKPRPDTKGSRRLVKLETEFKGMPVWWAYEQIGQAEEPKADPEAVERSIRRTRRARKRGGQ